MNKIQHDIVITGAGLITALGRTRDEVWQAVRAGRCGMGPMTAMESPLPPEKDGGQAVDLPEDFEPGLPREARYLRRAICDALSEARLLPPSPCTQGEGRGEGTSSTQHVPSPQPSPRVQGEGGPAPHRSAILVGTTLHGMRAAGQFLRTGDFGKLNAFLAGHTLDLAARDLPIEGLAATTCSACSSSLGSIALGVTLLESGEYDFVIAGGYDTVSEYVYGGFNSLRLVADGALRPFSRNRKGMKLSEGYGIVVLERAEDAARRGARPLVQIGGWGESADAHHLTQPDPRGTGASRAMTNAIERAGLTPADIDLIAAHATGTPDNDAAEFAALASVFGDRLRDVPVVGFKSHLGHTLGGAGAVELILSMMALREQTVPPCACVTNDETEFAGLNLATNEARPAKLRATLNTSLGFGGANTSVVLRHPRGTGGSPVSPEQNHGRAAHATTAQDVYITGIGVVLPGTVGNEAFLTRINCGSDTPAWENPSPPRVTDAELEGLLNARRVRRMSEYVKLQLAAATVACRDARIEDVAAFAQTCSAILGTTHGSATYSADYYGQIVRDGVFAANPMLFAEGVPNAGAAQLSLMLGIRGACQTIIGTRTSGLDALNLAAARIATGAWDRALVGAGEEHADIVRQAYEHCGLGTRDRGAGPFSEESGFVYGGGGAVALVLESRRSLESRAGARARAIVNRWSAARSARPTLPRAVGQVLRASADAGDVILSSACGTWLDRAELAAIEHRAREYPTTLSSIYGHVPELFSAGPLVAIATVLLGGELPRLLGGPLLPRNVRPADAGQAAGAFVSLATDFTGCVTLTRVQLL